MATARQPRATASIWTGHAKMVNDGIGILDAKGGAAFAQHVQGNLAEYRNLFGAINKGMVDSGYDPATGDPATGEPAGSAPPPPSNLPAPIVLEPWRQTMADQSGNIVVHGEFDGTAGRRRIHCVANQTYSVRFTVRMPGDRGYIDASPQARPSIAIVPSGAGAALMSVTDGPSPVALDGASFDRGYGVMGASGVAAVQFANDDFSRVAGRTLCANFMVGHDTDVFLEIALPTPLPVPAQ